jgi:hypothetical protein
MGGPPDLVVSRGGDGSSSARGMVPRRAAWKCEAPGSAPVLSGDSLWIWSQFRVPYI